MNFEEFVDQMMEETKNGLEERGRIGISVTLHKLDKINESYEAMSIALNGARVGVNINLDQLFEELNNGKSMEKLVGDTLDRIERDLNNIPDFDLDAIGDYDQMKHRLSVEVVSREENRELLLNVPHKDLEDMAIIYRFDLKTHFHSKSTLLVTNKILNYMGVTPEQLHEDALKSAPKLGPVVIMGMSEKMKEFYPDSIFLAQNPTLDENGNEVMYIASTASGYRGAGVMVYPDFFEKASEKVGGSFYVLPSSRHEVILVPDNGKISFEYLKSTVRSVNITDVPPVDKLTDNVYHYDAKERVFEMGEKYEDRKAERETRDSGRKETKNSLLGELKAKKEETTKIPPKDLANKTLLRGGAVIG